MGRAYQAEFESLEVWFNYGLTTLGHTFGQAASFSLVEHNRYGDPVGEALAVVALMKIALARDGVGFGLHELSWFVIQYCPDEIVHRAASEIEGDEDRLAFLRDVGEVRAALKVS